MKPGFYETRITCSSEIRYGLEIWGPMSQEPYTIPHSCFHVFLVQLSEITRVRIQDLYIEIYYVCVVAECRWEISEASSQFCSESKTTLKSKLY